MSSIVLVFLGVGYLIAGRWLFPAEATTAPIQLVEVPELIGERVEEARSRLRGQGLEVVLAGKINHPRADPGVVVAQSPLPGQLAQPEDSVRLTLSAGPRSVEVPALSGLSERQATEILERLGFTVRIRKVASPVGGVEGTSPAAGEALRPPAEVEIRVAEGPQTVAVPDLVGLHIDDVEALLSPFNLGLGSVRFAPQADEAPGRVIGQSPPAGYFLRVGGFISVEVAGTAGEGGRR